MFEITAYEPYARVSTNTRSLGLAVTDTWTFKAENGGTRVHYSADAETHGLFALADPIVARIVQRQFQGNLQTMKELLEASVPARR